MRPSSEPVSNVEWEKKGVLRKGKGGSSVQSVRFPTAELNAIRARAEQAGMTTSAYIRAYLRSNMRTDTGYVSSNVMILRSKLNESWTA